MSAQEKNVRTMAKIQINQIFKEISKILSYYECPASCDGICCKNSTIRFGKEEYHNIIKVVNPLVKDVLEQNTIPSEDIDFYRKLSGICPLLSANKCTLYKKRPAICKRYPFEIANNSSKDIIIRPCALGIDVILDCECFRDNIEDEQIFKDWIINKNNTVHKTAYVFGSSFDSNEKLKKFAKYLSKTSANSRALAREKLIEHIEESKKKII